MIAAVDVHYRLDGAAASAVLFRHWTDEEAGAVVVEQCGPAGAYEPGLFYVRELPCLLAVLSRVLYKLELVVVDGYALLDDGRLGLGGRLYRELSELVPVVGVAKSPFRSATHAREVYRGRSRRPLYVTAIGMDPDAAAQAVAGMAGSHRVPMLLRLADKLCRAEARHSYLRCAD